jgi:hypothetical protein
LHLGLSIDDRILTAAGGALATVGCAAFALHRMRGQTRIQAAWSALLGRPTAYRLHLRGTGIELAPWERNFVGEVVVRKPPEDCIYIGDDIPGQRRGSVIRNSLFTGAPRYGVHLSGAQDSLISDNSVIGDPADAGAAGLQGDEPEDGAPGLDEADEIDEGEVSLAEDAMARYWLPASCVYRHEFAAEEYARLGGRASITLSYPVTVKCPVCQESAEIKPGCYHLDGDRLVRANAEDPSCEESAWPSQNFRVTTAQ